jgi:hypothetical protein
MTTVFLSGSRKLSRINDAIRYRLDNMIEKNLSIIVGDANGADKAMQSYLAERSYKEVTVFFVGNGSRNNVGQWPSKNVETHKKLSGWRFYAQKDREMAKLADFGFVLWDGKSAGSVDNILTLMKERKKAVVYYAPEKKFYIVKTLADAIGLLQKCDPETYSAIDKKLGLTQWALYT